MSRLLFDFLTESPLWDERACSDEFADLDDDGFLAELEGLGARSHFRFWNRAYSGPT
jgi:hypothetical protein